MGTFVVSHEKTKEAPKTRPFGRVFGVQEVEGGDGVTRHVKNAHMGVFYMS